ncbi:uncharacterized transporter [[Candida] railenensis]|uniref:Uncharacterized transporter n=1 Tax=[Candida] railenensis TaxID=45579 RepID=A0A9P0QUI5_9ASCO|nr:uncharacterized transporter [[Candida] railenensis]
MNLNGLEAFQAILPPTPTKTVLTCLLWYLISSITSQLSKVILFKFTYPLFLSSCQFFIGGTLSYCFIEIANKYPEFASRYFPKGSVPVEPPSLVLNSGSKGNDTNKSLKIFNRVKFAQILPMGLFSLVGKIFSLNATSLISLATVSSVKALSPLLIVAGYRIVYGVKLPLVTYLSLVPLLFGVLLMILSDAIHSKKVDTVDQDSTTSTSYILPSIDYYQLKGLIFCLLSAITYAAQNIYSKLLVTWDALPGTNPKSLVLRTGSEKISTAPQVRVNNENPVVTPPHSPGNSSFFNFSPSKMVRQRTGSIKLPYSTSDLRLDVKKEEEQNHYSSYNQAVQQNNQEINNPFLSAVGGATASTNDTYEKPDKMTIILYCSIIGFIFSFGGFLTRELPEIFEAFTTKAAEAAAAATSTDSSTGNIINESTIDTLSESISLLILVFFDSLSHFLQTLLSFHLLGSIPALSYSIASMMKRIVLITVSIIFAVGIESNGSWYSHITREQFFGLILISIGLYCYDKWGCTDFNR